MKISFQSSIEILSEKTSITEERKTKFKEKKSSTNSNSKKELNSI